ncbi:hypothetical protein IV203_031530 [Nitzschia inconspicua]|uniref:Uncharacterized protein n=1 Tax=Nitzschia inconspicua TaxID=303405 RepID=A0A9K3Q2H3_9STRA|nr:hypothetical protein IV203_031530 [Nitzschia inconspicua]
MVGVSVVEKDKDVFGASVNDFDPWGDGGGFGDGDGDAGFGDFGNFEVMEGEISNDAPFFDTSSDLNSPEPSKDAFVHEEDHKNKPPTHRPSNRRRNPSRNGGTKGKVSGEGNEEENEGSRKPRVPMRRRSNCRPLLVDGDEKETKNSERSLSKSADKEVSVPKGECTEDNTSDKDRSRSEHSGRREAMRAQRGSFRHSKRTSVEEIPPSASSSRDKSPVKRGVNRRQSSSRKLMVQGEASGTRLVTQQSIRSLFQNGDLGDAEASPGTVGTNVDGAGCIVSHSRFQKPSRSRSGLAKSMSASAQALKSPEGDPQRRVNRSTSNDRKIEGIPSDSANVRLPQRTKSALVPRPSSVRRDISSDNLNSEERPEGSGDLLSPHGRRRPPIKSKSIGSVSLRERRLHHKQQESDSGGQSGSLRRPNRRLGYQDDGELKE